MWLLYTDGAGAGSGLYDEAPYLMEALGETGPLAEDDVIATLTALTARTVAHELERWGVEEVVAPGGGTANPTLMRMLAEMAPWAEPRTSIACGMSPSSKEAYAFAIMGFLTMHGLPANLPSCTGADSAVVLAASHQAALPLCFRIQHESHRVA